MHPAEIITWVLLGLVPLTWWAVFTFVEPSPPKAPKRVREPRYVAPRETTEQRLTYGLITILLLDLLVGRDDH